jgi:hypothetical protein
MLSLGGQTLKVLRVLTTAFILLVWNGATTALPLNQKPRRFRLPDKQFDRIVLIANLDGKVYARCYTGKTYVDAVVPYGCLAVLVSDGAKMLSHLYQKMVNEVADKAA